MQGLAILRRQTTQFINENPSDISFEREVNVDDGAGGVRKSRLPLTPQRVRVIEQERSAEVESASVGGEVLNPDYVIIAEHDADIQEGDSFNWRGRSHEIKYVRLDKPYEVWAQVKRMQRSV